MQRDSFVYLGGAICGDGNSDTEIRIRIRAVTNAWRKDEGMMGDRRISRKLKGKVHTSCVAPAYVHGLETMAVIEKQQTKVQICEKQLNKKTGRTESGGWSEGKF